MQVLKGRGIPQKWLRYISALYRERVCHIVLAGVVFPGFALTAGSHSRLSFLLSWWMCASVVFCAGSRSPPHERMLTTWPSSSPTC